ncbi:MAG: UDP-3-O-(3-hydroxymyristoyl)glucosamine N-acyltransferase [Rickettsiella sp.]|nr:UDP-3-O-(3-hydroxymyristoyl)glucosamine N-acyltransferase [Rickettsiella sp.]
MQRSYRLEEIAYIINADLKGDPDCLISGIMTLQNAKPGQISFLDNHRYLKYLAQTKASAVILRPEHQSKVPSSCHVLVTVDPYLAFAKITERFKKKNVYGMGMHSTCIIGKNCNIDPSASIAPFCVLGNNVCLEQGVIIGSGCSIGDGVTIGAKSRLEPNVTLYADTIIGENVIIHSGSVIGSDGFGLAKDKENWVKIPQLGKVQIANDVEIGANVTIDRGALEDTFIDTGVKLDNQIQIGHNVHIGANTAIAGCTGIAGSTRIGKNCMIGGGVCINGHIEIADNVNITGSSSIVHSIRTSGTYSSTQSIQPQREWQKNSARFRQLDKIARRLKKIENFFSQKVKILEKSK